MTVIFGGLSVVAFLTFFLSRPLQALEENLQFITWLGVVYNTYWTRLVNAQNPDTFQADLSAATEEFVQQLNQLVNVHAESSAKRPTIETKRKWWFFYRARCTRGPRPVPRLCSKLTGATRRDRVKTSLLF